MLGIMAGMNQKDCFALFVSGSGMCKARFAGFLHLVMSSLPWFAGPDARHHGRYEPEGQLCGEMVVVILVVPQRLIPMVWSTIEIPQLQFLDKVIDDPAVRVVQVSPGRSQARCVQRQVPWLRSAVAVHQQGCPHPRRGAEAFPWSRLFV